MPQGEQTLREAYTPTKGLGPSLTIDDPSDDRWASLVVQPKPNGLVAIFTRLFMMPDRFAILSSPETEFLPNPDLVAVCYDKLVDTFRRYFRIVQPEEFGLIAPITMPHTRRH